MTTATTPFHDPADWSDLSKPEYSGRIIEAKIHGPVGNADYLRQEHPRGHKDYVMSRSEMKNFASNPARWIKGYREGETSEKRFGSLLDALVFSPDTFSERFVVAPKTYPASKGNKRKGVKKGDPVRWNANANYCIDWAESQPDDATIINFTEADDAMAARMALMADPIIRAYIEDAEYQVLVTGKWQGFDGGPIVPLKACVDIVPTAGDSLGDLKTTCSASPYHSDKETDRFWYSCQGSLYLDLFEAAGDKRTDFKHVLIENFPPFQTGRRYLSSECLREGREKYNAALKLYAECLTNNEWPSHEDLPANKSRAPIAGWLATEPMMKRL